MKTALLFALLFILTTPKALLAAWGVSGGVGYWKMDAKEFERYAAYRKAYAPPIFVSKIARGNISQEIGMFYETSGGKKLNYGISLGYGTLPKVKYLRAQGILTVYETYNTDENTTRTIPAYLYAKWGARESRFRIFGGVGAEYLMARTETKGYYADIAYPAYSNSWDVVFKKNRFVPGAILGGEYFLFKNLSLGVNLKYLFSAELKDLRGKKDGVEWRMIMTRDAFTNTEFLNVVAMNYKLTAKDRLFRYDYTGLRINLAAKLYFGR